MPIPTDQDYALGEIDNLANSVKVRLTTMRYAGETPRDIVGLRDVLREYVGAVMTFAHGTEQ